MIDPELVRQINLLVSNLEKVAAYTMTVEETLPLINKVAANLKTLVRYEA